MSSSKTTLSSLGQGPDLRSIKKEYTPQKGGSLAGFFFQYVFEAPESFPGYDDASVYFLLGTITE